MFSPAQCTLPSLQPFAPQYVLRLRADLDHKKDELLSHTSHSALRSPLRAHYPAGADPAPAAVRPVASQFSRDPLFKTNVRVFIGQILAAPLAPGSTDTMLLLGLRPVQRVEIVGTIVSARDTPERITYIVDDGTGALRCQMWFASGTGTGASAAVAAAAAATVTAASAAGSAIVSDTARVRASGVLLKGRPDADSLTFSSAPDAEADTDAVGEVLPPLLPPAPPAPSPVLGLSMTSGEPLLLPVGTVVRLSGLIKRFRGAPELAISHGAVFAAPAEAAEAEISHALTVTALTRTIYSVFSPAAAITGPGAGRTGLDIGHAIEPPRDRIQVLASAVARWLERQFALAVHAHWRDIGTLTTAPLTAAAPLNNQKEVSAPLVSRSKRARLADAVGDVPAGSMPPFLMLHQLAAASDSSDADTPSTETDSDSVAECGISGCPSGTNRARRRISPRKDRVRERATLALAATPICVSLSALCEAPEVMAAARTAVDECRPDADATTGADPSADPSTGNSTMPVEVPPTTPAAATGTLSLRAYRACRLALQAAVVRLRDCGILTPVPPLWVPQSALPGLRARTAALAMIASRHTSSYQQQHVPRAAPAASHHSASGSDDSDADEDAEAESRGSNSHRGGRLYSRAFTGDADTTAALQGATAAPRRVVKRLRGMSYLASLPMQDGGHAAATAARAAPANALANSIDSVVLAPVCASEFVPRAGSVLSPSPSLMFSPGAAVPAAPSPNGNAGRAGLGPGAGVCLAAEASEPANVEAVTAAALASVPGDTLWVTTPGGHRAPLLLSLLRLRFADWAVALRVDRSARRRARSKALRAARAADLAADNAPSDAAVTSFSLPREHFNLSLCAMADSALFASAREEASFAAAGRRARLSEALRLLLDAGVAVRTRSGGVAWARRPLEH